MTWELQRNVDVIVLIKSDHLFKERVFLPQAQFMLSSFPSELVLLNGVTTFSTDEWICPEKKGWWGEVVCSAITKFEAVAGSFACPERPLLYTERQLDIEACLALLELRKIITILYLLNIYCFHTGFCIYYSLCSPVGQVLLLRSRGGM